jgi:hypothetical protein
LWGKLPGLLDAGKRQSAPAKTCERKPKSRSRSGPQVVREGRERLAPWNWLHSFWKNQQLPQGLQPTFNGSEQRG